MHSFQIFLILNIYTTQIVYKNNKDYDKLIQTIPGWKHDFNRQKWYIPSAQTNKFIESLNNYGISWAKSDLTYNTTRQLNNYLSSGILKKENKYNIVVNDLIRTGTFKNLYELDNFQKENSVRIKSLSKNCIVVSLPISRYSFSKLSHLRKAYSMVSFGWVLVGDIAIREFYKCCEYNNINIINEDCNSFRGDVFLKY